MAMGDGDEVRRPAPWTIGEDLSEVSVAEIDERIGALQAEIERLTRERNAKSSSLDAANALFRR